MTSEGGEFCRWLFHEAIALLGELEPIYKQLHRNP